MNARCAKMLHHKCRQGWYPSSSAKRFEILDEKVAWSVEYPEYKPMTYTADAVRGKPWADPEISESTFKPKWNALDSRVNRKSFTGDYIISTDGYPLNPVGRTGVVGRGLLGRWGPNHAADPIVTRWKRNSNGNLQVNLFTRKPILQFVAIQRRDNEEWAIPGGMVDPGETVSLTLMREFMEEALNSLETGDTERESIRSSIREFFAKGNDIYKGYVDDPRNTDNAWIETTAMNFHDQDSRVVGKLALKAGDDARGVKWMDIDRQINLYASHDEFIQKTALVHKAHW